jgi:hypothetical protein
MLRKFLTLFMVFAILTVQAQASTQSGLKAAFDELNYALSVEWDQKDKNFQTEQMKKFSAQLRELQAQGLTQTEMIEFAKSQVKDKRLAKELETAFSMIKINQMSATEANKYMLDIIQKSYSAGASWSGDVFIILGATMLLVLLAVGIANGNVTVSGSICGYSDVYLCETYCYNDWFWGTTCYEDCFWTTQYSCI